MAFPFQAWGRAMRSVHRGARAVVRRPLPRGGWVWSQWWCPSRSHRSRLSIVHKLCGHQPAPRHQQPINGRRTPTYLQKHSLTSSKSLTLTAFDITPRPRCQEKMWSAQFGLHLSSHMIARIYLCLWISLKMYLHVVTHVSNISTSVRSRAPISRAAAWSIQCTVAQYMYSMVLHCNKLCNKSCNHNDSIK